MTDKSHIGLQHQPRSVEVEEELSQRLQLQLSINARNLKVLR